jgi:hypothetical protein
LLSNGEGNELRNSQQFLKRQTNTHNSTQEEIATRANNDQDPTTGRTTETKNKAGGGAQTQCMVLKSRADGGAPAHKAGNENPSTEEKILGRRRLGCGRPQSYRDSTVNQTWASSSGNPWKGKPGRWLLWGKKETRRRDLKNPNGKDGGAVEKQALGVAARNPSPLTSSTKASTQTLNTREEKLNESAAQTQPPATRFRGWTANPSALGEKETLAQKKSRRRRPSGGNRKRQP